MGLSRPFPPNPTKPLRRHVGKTVKNLKTAIIVGLAFLLPLINFDSAKAADSGPVDIRAVVVTPGFCVIFAASTTLDFGNLDPLNPVDVNASASLGFLCLRFPFGSPVTYFVSDDDGLYETGPNANRMIHSTNPAWYLPYSLTVVNDAATIPSFTGQTLDINASINGADYVGALRGNYTDIVTITIVP